MIIISIILVAACKRAKSDLTDPVIRDISISSNVLVISDCQADSVTITARVIDESRITQVLLWYRVGADQPFTSDNMHPQCDQYSGTVKGSEFLGRGYGAMEFYITAQDEQGNISESPHDDSIQFLPCVSN